MHRRIEKRATYYKAWREAERNKDIDAYRLQDWIAKNSWAAKNRDRVKKTAGRVRAKAKGQRRRLW
jgi:hypothetical protein